MQKEARGARGTLTLGCEQLHSKLTAMPNLSEAFAVSAVVFS